MVPTADEQVQFLLKIQRLLGEGLFTATYKYALLLALADLALELGDDSGEALELNTYKIGEKFVEYYWRQTLPFLGKDVLLQNKGKAPVVVTLLLQARTKYGDHLADAKLDGPRWQRLVDRVAGNVRKMPLQFLQNIGRQSLPFLYDPPAGTAPTIIHLYPGVAYCLRRFHGLVTDLVQAAWVRWVHQQNLALIGDKTDLHEFLFGAERGQLSAIRNVLQDLQRGACFYCHREMRAQEVDHFVPWVLYPLDLGHNFVLAHPECNLAKRDLLASEEHLAAWVERNHAYGDALGHEYDRVRVMHDITSTKRIARWAYASASTTGGLTWKSKQDLVVLTGEWDRLL